MEIIEGKVQVIKGAISSFEDRLSALETTTRSIKKDLKVLASKKEKQAPSSDEGGKCKKKKVAAEAEEQPRPPGQPIPYIIVPAPAMPQFRGQPPQIYPQYMFSNPY